MHVPDGFLDAPTSIATGVIAAVGVGSGPARGPQGARRAHRTAGRGGRGVRVRDADDQLPGRGGHQRASPRRGAGGRPGRPVDRRAGDHRRAVRPGPAVRRRRAHRPRHQHHLDGTGRCRCRLAGHRGGPPIVAQAPGLGADRGRHRRAGLGARRRDRVHDPVRHRRSGRDPRRRGVHRDGRMAQSDRHRRGRHHRAGGQRGRGHPARSGVRRPPDPAGHPTGDPAERECRHEEPTDPTPTRHDRRGTGRGAS